MCFGGYVFVGGCMGIYMCVCVSIYVYIYIYVYVWVWMCDWPLSLSSHSSQYSTTGVTKAMGWYL